MNINEKALLAHKNWQGKIEVISRASIKSREDLSVAYTPGVAAPCLEIHKDKELSYEYTRKKNLVAVITDGSAVLGLGDIGGAAGMPVMEGKCALFKEFADIDAFPLCINSRDTDEIVRTIHLMSDSFGGINLEDISAPRCFEIEKRLIELCDIPIFHDDQHGTAIVVGAALINALKVAEKDIHTAKVVINGAGAAGISIAKHVMALGVQNLTLVDRFGAIYDGKEENNQPQAEMAKITNKEKITGTLADAIRGADVFIGVSAPGILTADMVRSMADRSIVFPMANPTPEIMPDKALEAGAYIVGTGRSDFKNQINNLLAFPGIFRGALDCRASRINNEMKIAASLALASIIGDDELSADNIIPSVLDTRVCPTVARAVMDAAVRSGVAKIVP